jgi:hypothetical protein
MDKMKIATASQNAYIATDSASQFITLAISKEEIDIESIFRKAGLANNGSRRDRDAQGMGALQLE